MLWQACAWREELIQLLELLAERADRRRHPLPWALPVPLRVHGHYSRAEIEAAYCFAYACGYVREQRKQDGRTGAPTEPFVCLRFATNASHEGERPMAWLPGCCLAVQRRWRFEGGRRRQAVRVRLMSGESNRQTMADVKSLEQAVEALDPSALAEFRRWFEEFDAAALDHQLEADATAGKLDALLADAEDDYRNQPHRPL